MKAKLTTIATNVNDYFFDIDPEEPTDWTSLVLFYGVVALCIALSAICIIGLTI